MWQFVSGNVRVDISLEIEQGTALVYDTRMLFIQDRNGIALALANSLLHNVFWRRVQSIMLLSFGVEYILNKSFLCLLFSPIDYAWAIFELSPATDAVDTNATGDAAVYFTPSSNYVRFDCL